jgi:microcystin-dependent protein
MDPTMAEIQCFAGNFAPQSWAFCQGQLMSIAQNTALFSLLGTTYGGDGQVTFGLPDFRSRMAVGANGGTGPGLPTINLGEMSGTENVTMLSSNMPAHIHTLSSAKIAVNGGAGDSSSPVGAVLASHPNAFSESFGANQNLAPSISGNVAISGGSQPFPIRIPYLGLNFIIAVEGIYPSRN